MDIKSINNKRVVDGKVIITEPVLVFPKDIDVIFTHIVDADEEGRPDRIALKYYGTDEFVDLILKWNGISNPFSLNAGDEIEVPTSLITFKKFIKPNRQSGTSAKDKFVAQRKMTTKDLNRLEFLQKKSEGLPNGSKESLPPNRHKSGDTNTVMKGDIYRSSNPSNLDS